MLNWIVLCGYFLFLQRIIHYSLDAVSLLTSADLVTRILTICIIISQINCLFSALEFFGALKLSDQSVNLKCIGVDLGTSTIKVSFGDKRYRIPSIIGEPNPGGFAGITQDTSWENNLVAIIDNQEWYVGELARVQSVLKIPLAREGKVKSTKEAKIAVLSALGIIHEPHQDIKYVVGTGVPVATGTSEMQELSKAIVGKHKFTLKNDATGEVKTINLHVVAAPVLPEPYGCYYYVLKSRGIEKAFDAVIIDVGFGTTDILSIHRGTIVRPASGSTPDAIDTLAEKLASFLEEHTGYIVKLESLAAALEKGTKITIGGVVYDIKPQLERVAQIVAESILDTLDRLIRNLPPQASVKYYILTGGGIYILGKYLKDALIERKLATKEQILIPDDPVMANSIGFELVARYFAEKKLPST